MGRRAKLKTLRALCPVCRRCWAGTCSADWRPRAPKRSGRFPWLTCGECVARGAKGK